MQFIECGGTPRQIGEATGEALRQDIAEHLELFPLHRSTEFRARLPLFLTTLRRHLPAVVEEIRATARAANVDEVDLFALNLPLVPGTLDRVFGEIGDGTPGGPDLTRDLPSTDGCTNFVFTGGPDGPIWGKNNDGCHPHRPVVARYVRPAEGIPQVTFTFAGVVATTDGMNAEGVAVGHSSVGSVFQQSDRWIPIRLWAYQVMSRARTTAEFVRAMAEQPLRGKGYSIVCVDRLGDAVSIEAACPVLMIREPVVGAHGLHCVNCYQDEALWHADRRTPEGKVDAHERWHLLDRVLLAGEGPPAQIDVTSGWPGQVDVPDPGQDGYDLAFAERLLHLHGDICICRHGEPLDYHSEYSMIGLPASGRLRFCGLHPCQQQYTEVSL
ncbi:MAG: hypothetical protein HN712_24895 [Gemmatimonadetes bacterium]|jgi:hypothetical protein|nr:hypothetical protein [Gemmatimonadota bacterium]MBT6146063.1 hypothetical protein [Gemmatimonadota bacterium]MBT7863578.1 hypothetical protein [Gemmatimonadota bacterium]